MELRERLLFEIQNIAGRPVSWDENLVAGAIDSLGLAELVSLIEGLAKEHKRSINLDRLISEEVLTPQKIYSEITA